MPRFVLTCVATHYNPNNPPIVYTEVLPNLGEAIRRAKEQSVSYSCHIAQVFDFASEYMEYPTTMRYDPAVDSLVPQTWETKEPEKEHDPSLCSCEECRAVHAVVPCRYLDEV